MKTSEWKSRIGITCMEGIIVIEEGIPLQTVSSRWVWRTKYKESYQKAAALDFFFMKPKQKGFFEGRCWWGRFLAHLQWPDVQSASGFGDHSWDSIPLHLCQDNHANYWSMACLPAAGIIFSLRILLKSSPVISTLRLYCIPTYLLLFMSSAICCCYPGQNGWKISLNMTPSTCCGFSVKTTRNITLLGVHSLHAILTQCVFIDILCGCP